MTDQENQGVEPDAYSWYEHLYNSHKMNSILNSMDDEMEKMARRDLEALFSSSTIRHLWMDDFKPSIIGEAEELRERGIAEDVAEQLEHLAERFEEVFSSE